VAYSPKTGLRPNQNPSALPIENQLQGEPTGARDRGHDSGAPVS
jgi:hypothetical protein